MAALSAQGTSQVCTLTQQKTNRRWLGSYGHVNGLNWDFTSPGGADSMSCTLGKPPQWRADVLDPGRIVEIWRGAARIWFGILDEATPDTSGWSITAHGSGTFGSTILGHYTNWNIDEPIDNAISGQGLLWRKPHFGDLGFTPNAPGDATSYINDILNSFTIQAGKIWNVDCRNHNMLSIAAPPSLSSPTRLLVCTVPNPRTLAAGLNALWFTYVSAVFGSNQTTSTDSVSNAAAIAKHGRLEQAIDLTQLGLLTNAQAKSYAQNVMNQYIRANFASDFQVRHGQYLTIGGSAVDLGCETAYPNVVRLLLTDGSYGGEVISTPVTFAVGKYGYSEETQLGTVTPYQSYKSDLSTLLTAAIPGLRQ